MRSDVALRFIIQNDKARKMQALELAERNKGILGIDHAGAVVHGSKQLSQVRFPIRLQRRNYRERGLWDHGVAPPVS